ncbi:MAG: VanZ family protein [Cutibacterium avidum]|nr:VanZ family protein [Cutibacterium avidum]
MAHHFAGAPVMEVLTSSSMMQMVLNVALFLPLGFYAVRLLRMRPWSAVLFGFGTSLAIELTQYTGNWFLSNCQYRVADINDLITNTLGGIFGVLTTTFAPHFSQTPEKMEKQADKSRAVTKGRRFLALLIDVWWVVLIDIAAMGITAAIGMVLLYNNPENKTAAEDAMETYGTPLLVALPQADVTASSSVWPSCAPSSPTPDSASWRLSEQPSWSSRPSRCCLLRVA